MRSVEQKLSKMAKFWLSKPFLDPLIYFIKVKKNLKMTNSVTKMTCFSMTSLLTHTVAHFTRHSFRPKTNNQPLKKFFKSCGQLSKSRQELDVILENKVVQKLEFPKNVNNKRCAPKIKFFNENKCRKIRIIFDTENWLWKSEFCHFWQLLLNWPQDLKTF